MLGHCYNNFSGELLLYFDFRGENGPGCFAISPADDDPECSNFQWVLNTDLKGWIPKAVIESTLTNVQLDFLKHLRKRVDQLSQSSAS